MRPGRPFAARFYDRATESVALELLGAVLECRAEAGIARGRIVEVEAYLGPHDAACHSAVGLTERNRHLHGPPGTAYVYFSYGMHWMMNAVTRETGYGSAVLIRAIEPLDGLPLMLSRRRGGEGARTVTARNLANGPGKLTEALGIDRRFDGVRLDRGALRILEGERVPPSEIAVSPRIGIRRAAEWPLRFFERSSAWASRTPTGFPVWALDHVPRAAMD